MTQPVPLEERVRRLERTVTQFAQRLDALERSQGAVPEAAPAGAPPAGAVSSALEPEAALLRGADRLQGVPALVGRTCLVLGGAFLIRALTEGGVLSNAVGVTLGIVYSLVWLLLADRAAARGEHVPGAFHALASALIVYPLLLEATIRFALLPAWPAVALLSGATALGLFVAWRRAFRTVAWITVIAALSDGVLLLFRTRQVLPFVLFLVALAVASLLLAYGRGWRGQRWLVAVALDVVVALLGALLLVPRPPEWLPVRSVLVAQVALVVVYLGAFVLRLLIQERSVTPFAIAQTIIVLVVGFEGALLVSTGTTRLAIAAGALACGAVLHGILARRSERRPGHGEAVAYFSSLATFLAAESTRVLLPGWMYPALWVTAAVMLAALALFGARPILQAHAALLTAAGALASGLLAASFSGLAGRAQSEWPPLTPTAMLVLALAVVTAVLLVRGAPRPGPSGLATSARMGTIAVAAYCIAGSLVRVAAGALADAPGAGAQAGRLAVIRSAVLAAAAVALAAWRAAGGRRELMPFAWIVLAIGGLKLLGEDLRVGSAAHLVMSLACYGVALIVVPALVRGDRSQPNERPT